MTRSAFRTAAATFAVAVAAATLAAPFAMAQEATPDYPTVSTSKLTRAEVLADLAQARADGSIKVWSTSYNPLTVAKSQRTREAVRAETAAAPTAAIDLTGEDSGSFALSRTPVQRAPAALARVR